MINLVKKYKNSKEKKPKGPHVSYKYTTIDVVLTEDNCRVSKHKISLVPLRPLHGNILKDNNIFKKYKNDKDYVDLVECIFRIESKYDDTIKTKHRIFIDKNKDDIIIGTKDEIEANRKLHDWKCAYCKTPIISIEDDFTPQNFCCKRCGDIYLGRSTIKTAVLQSSYMFSEMLKAKIRRRESIMMSYIKENLDK